MVGLDGTVQLIEVVRQAGSGEFRVISCEGIADGRLKTPWIRLSSNSILPGKDVVGGLILPRPSLLNGHGACVSGGKTCPIFET